MQLSNPIEKIASSIFDAAHNQFSPFTYKNRDWAAYRKDKTIKEIELSRRPEHYDVELFSCFAQTWGSTALGFGGMGGTAMTPDYTTIVRFNREYCVYFGGRFAYKIDGPNDEFFQAIKHRSLAPVSEKEKYETN